MNLNELTYSVPMGRYRWPWAANPPNGPLYTTSPFFAMRLVDLPNGVGRHRQVLTKQGNWINVQPGDITICHCSGEPHRH